MVANEIRCNAAFMNLRPGDRVFQFHNPAFDGAGPELVGVLCFGATLILWHPGDNSVDMVQKASLNKIVMTPSGLSVLDPATVRLAVLGVGAVALPLQLAKTWAARTTMWNFYGPSETTVDATATRVTSTSETIHIGRPIPNATAYILSGLSLQPEGCQVS